MHNGNPLRPEIARQYRYGPQSQLQSMTLTLGRALICHFYHGGSYTPLARFDCGEGDGDLLFTHAESNGMPLLLSDLRGEVVWQQTEAGLFGRIKRESSQLSPWVAKQNLRFAGQYHDEETGLHYNTLRYYDPESGRFTQPDPIGLAGGINLYSYAPNPLTWIDPFGLSGEWVNTSDINFSQRTISANDYAEIMRNGQWDWNRSPLSVIDVNGQLVTYDNRRLDAALEAGLDKVKVTKVDPHAPHPDSTTGKTWWQKFQQRFRDRRNVRAGGIVPDQGLNTRPTKCG